MGACCKDKTMQRQHTCGAKKERALTPLHCWKKGFSTASASCGRFLHYTAFSTRFAVLTKIMGSV